MPHFTGKKNLLFIWTWPFDGHKDIVFMTIKSFGSIFLIIYMSALFYALMWYFSFFGSSHSLQWWLLNCTAIHVEYEPINSSLRSSAFKNPDVLLVYFAYVSSFPTSWNVECSSLLFHNKTLFSSFSFSYCLMWDFFISSILNSDLENAKQWLCKF